MNILFVVPYVPNQIRVRSYHLIRELARRNHRLLLATLWTADEEQRDLEALAAQGIQVISEHMPTWRSLINGLRTLGTMLPLQATYSWRPRFARALAQALVVHNIDMIHVEHLRGIRYGLHLQREISQQQLSIPIVWDSVDCISHLFQQAAQYSRSLQGRIMTQLDLPRTRRYEGWLVHQFDNVLVTSPTDKAALLHLASQTAHHPNSPSASELCHYLDEKLNVLPNGVDLAYFSPNSLCPDSARIVFSGKMSYHANITAALHLVHDIMPRVWAHRPDAEVWIVGKDPAPAIQALATGKATSPSQGRVVVTGSVPDIRPYLYQAAVAVAPLVYGAGIQNKVLEAMACATPVVASLQATSALDVTSGCELLIASDSSAFAEAILSLLANPSRRQQLGQNGRTYVEQKHSWDWASAQLEQLYARAIDAHRIKQ